MLYPFKKYCDLVCQRFNISSSCSTNIYIYGVIPIRHLSQQILLETFIKSTPVYVFLLLTSQILKYGFYIQNSKEVKNITLTYHEHTHIHTHTQHPKD